MIPQSFFVREKVAQPPCRSSLLIGSLAQSVFPKPQLIPRRIIAFSLGFAAASRARMPSAEKMRSVCSSRSRSNADFEGRLKLLPKRGSLSM